MVILRIRKYRQEFALILDSSGSGLTKNRFTRLFLMALTLIVVIIPVETYILYIFAIKIDLSYDWALVHGSDWGSIILTPTGGSVQYDRWIQVGLGFAVFVFFGLGHDAQEMYRKFMLRLGMGRIFPTLRLSKTEKRRLRASAGSETVSDGSRVHLFAKRFSRASLRSL